MKVIGRVSEKTLIVEITEDEIAQIDGFKSSFMRSEYSGGPRKRVPCVGDTIPVNEWWSIVTRMRDKEIELRKMGETLKSLGMLVTDAWPQIITAMQEEPKE